MAGGKIIPLIDYAEKRANGHADAEVLQLIDAVDAQLEELERQLDVKIAQIIERIEKLEEGGTP